tara:strand:- start:3011 stop:3376 length:366 start_codon:yes stop_codon:yes gene_type:complete
MPKENIEQIFRSSETEKRISLSTGAWNRLDDLLEKDKQKTTIFRFRILGIAASVAVLFVAFVAPNNNNNNEYILEQLVIDKGELLYSSSEVAQLNSKHQISTLQKLRPFYNANGEVRATVN